MTNANEIKKLENEIEKMNIMLGLRELAAKMKKSKELREELKCDFPESKRNTHTYRKGL